MCDFVAEIHLRSKSSRHHQIVTILEAQGIRQLQKAREILRPKSCLSHHRSYEYYDLTCEKLLCIDCWMNSYAGSIIIVLLFYPHVVTHTLTSTYICLPGHPTSPISDPALMDRMAERVRGLSSRLEARMTEMVEAEQTLSRLVQELDESTEGVLREIGEEFGKLRQMLDRRQTELETKTRELRKSKRFVLQDQMDRVGAVRSNASVKSDRRGGSACIRLRRQRRWSIHLASWVGIWRGTHLRL